MALEQPKLTPWNEKEVGKLEEFIVYSPTRINSEDGQGALSYKRGEKIKLHGNTKKDLYFQNKIMYPKDFEAVDEYEKEMKTAYKGKVEVNTDSAAEGLTASKKKK